MTFKAFMAFRAFMAFKAFVALKAYLAFKAFMDFIDLQYALGGANDAEANFCSGNGCKRCLWSHRHQNTLSIGDPPENQISSIRRIISTRANVRNYY
uniref:Uncharacterized protein n=1 Tax=Romanomermis culicivorax TaxID=13658 RepID=A0A915JMC9_ROMCU